MSIDFVGLGFYLTLGCALLWGAWRYTRGVRNLFLRWAPRGLALAMVFTPTMVPVRSLHGFLPAPASWVLLAGIFADNHEDRAIALYYGGKPLGYAFLYLWLLGVAFAYVCRGFRRRIVGLDDLPPTQRHQ